MIKSEELPAQVAGITAPQQLLQRALPALERQIDDAVAMRPQAVGLQVGGVEIIDSAALNWLLAVQSRLETLGMKLVLVNPSGILTDALLATRLDTRLTIESDQASTENRGRS